MNIAELVAAIATPVFIALGLVFGAGRWIGKVDENTKATQNLTLAFEAHSEKIGNEVADHEVRIRLLESAR